jgi:hypothetical protein
MEDEFKYYKSELKTKPPVIKNKEVEENEAEAQAKSKSVALNINWNVLYYPGYDGDALNSAKNDPLKDPGFSPKEIMEKFFKEDEQEAIALAEAKSGAEVKNKNVNVVIYCK